MKTNSLNKKIKNTFVLQQDQNDCGAACILSLLQFYGGNSSIEKIRELSGTNKTGTTLLGLYQAADKLGFTAEGNKTDIQELMKYNHPLILLITNENKLNHYIISYGYNKRGGFVIGDPAKGIIQYSKKNLEKAWQSQACLTLIPNESFIKNEIATYNKRKWFITLLKDDMEILKHTVLLGLCVSITGLSLAVFSQRLIDNILPMRNVNGLITGLILFSCILLIRVIFMLLRDYFLIKQTKNFNIRIVDYFYSKLLNLPKLFFDTRKIGELVARLNDTQRIQKVISMIVGTSIIDALTIVTSLAFLYYYSLNVGIIATFSLPIYFMLIYKFNDAIILAQKDVMQAGAFNESNYIVTMQGITAIKNCNQTSFFKQLNQNIYGNLQQKIFQLNKLNIKLSFYSRLFELLFLAIILGYTSKQVINDYLQIGELVAILGILGSLMPTVSSLALISIPINEAKVAFNRMYEFTTIKEEAKGHISMTDFQSLDIKNISFRFSGQQLLLNNITFSIKKNECMALIGESGCGKSTFIQILQKFYQCESGSIIINNSIDLKNIQTKDWRNIIGIVPQEIAIFNGNVIDNILLGENDTPNNVILFIKQLELEEFINELPQGYTTLLGEEGVNLSGGQKQIIALIRALYRNPQLLILDEFTSNIDHKSEQVIINQLIKLKSKTTIIIITHRLHTIKQIADKICIIPKGNEAIVGTHEQLIKSINFYSKNL